MCYCTEKVKLYYKYYFTESIRYQILYLINIYQQGASATCHYLCVVICGFKHVWKTASNVLHLISLFRNNLNS